MLVLKIKKLLNKMEEDGNQVKNNGMLQIYNKSKLLKVYQKKKMINLNKKLKNKKIKKINKNIMLI